ncbi:MAG: response regulator transcription factor [Cyanobacteria bacterium J06635_15]
MGQQTLDVELQQFLVIDDHEAILEGTVPALQKQYPKAQISTAKTVQAAEWQILHRPPDLVIVDLSLPVTANSPATAEVGIRLLDKLMGSDRAPNIMVLSTNVKPLIRLKPVINAYEGGFVAMDKSLPIQNMLNSVEIALRGSIYLPPEVRARPEFDRKWLEVLKLKYQEGLSDKAIAKAMGISDRTIRNYWVRIQDGLSVYDDPNKDLRIQIQIAARKAGLIN